jgi:GTP 3',8-cyclase
MLQDSFGRSITYVRLSVIGKALSRAMYPAADPPAPGDELLTPGELEQVARRLVALGVRKIRLAGPEPTERADLVDIVGRLARIEGLDDLALTTGGTGLAPVAADLAAAGLQRINIALDSLDAEKYHRITGVDALPRVLEGIDAAIAAGLNPLKLNTVVLRGENDYELAEMLIFAAWKKADIRFIELMPTGMPENRWQRRYIPEEEMRQRLSSMGICWVARPDTRDPARQYTAGLSFGRSVRVGFITAVSCPFCSTCNRLRIAADGSLFPCLTGPPAGSLLPALRPGFNPAELDRILQQAIAGKAQEHPLGCTAPI